ncbi:TNT domain-containing protein [Cryobacterium sp. PH31-O1]|uniref:TNT domain-containing protein n=1 Tax=Cryobacterium sp. PH31-O1 TaxID=3046306 RepID=UPI0024B99658|nr:TNT domain-containing protein [Cryobacterium sp. PH31-O1]MDJ0338530.1 TNT domain-containing protein [Cryobacterium sp. PH31-O1]
MPSAADAAPPQGLSRSSADASGVGEGARPAGLATVSGDGAPSAGTPTTSVVDLDERFDKLSDDINADFDKLEADAAASSDRLDTGDGEIPAASIQDRIDTLTDPLHSCASRGEGWERLADDPVTPKDLHYGETLSGSGTSTYPVETPMNEKTFDLIADSAAPYGREVDGTPLSQGTFDSRYVFLNGHDNYPPNSGATRGTRVAYDDYGALQRDYGTTLDRIGYPGGTYLGLRVDGVSAPFEARSLPISSLDKPFAAYDVMGVLPPGWTVKVSEIAPGVGRAGGGIQIRYIDDAGEAVPVYDLLGVLIK